MRASVLLAVVVLIPMGYAHAQIPPIERDALIALYNSTDGANWSNSGGWLGTPGTECSWYGVTCAGGQVLRITLYSNQLSGVIPPELGNLSSLWSLDLNSNQLSRGIPPELGNLSSLTNGSGLDLRWNALHSDNATLIAFLNTKQDGGDWQSTQTIAPENLSVDSVGDHTAWLSWDAVSYVSDPGGYEVLYATAPGGPYTAAGQTADKTISSYELNTLAPGTTYFIVVRTVTEPHTNNQNTVVSEMSAEVTVSTLETLAIATASLPAGVMGQPYSAVVGATGGVPPYAFAIAGGALPPGLDLDAGTGEITGTPVSNGEYPFTVEVTDDLGQTARAELGIAILQAAQVPDLGSAGRILFVLLLAGAGIVAVRHCAA